MDKNIIDKAFSFLRTRDPKLCSLSTVSGSGDPESAVMGYALGESNILVFSTDKNSRKVPNIEKNHRVAMIFGWSFGELNIQMEGAASLVTGGNDLHACEDIYFAAHPEALEFKGTPETIYIKVQPVWLRLSDYNPNPPDIKETNIEFPDTSRQ